MIDECTIVKWEASGNVCNMFTIFILEKSFKLSFNAFFVFDFHIFSTFYPFLFDYLFIIIQYWFYYSFTCVAWHNHILDMPVLLLSTTASENRYVYTFEFELVDIGEFKTWQQQQNRIKIKC